MTKLVVKMEKTSPVDFKALNNFVNAVKENQNSNNLYFFEMRSKPTSQSNIRLECTNIDEICDCLDRIVTHHN